MKTPTYQHPRGLLILSFAEFWDRFGFCGTLTILLLYTTQTLSLSSTESNAIWGVFLALGYILPVSGGGTADKILGFERSILLGSLLMITGFLTLSLPFTFCFYIGLALTLSGIGLFKGNISSLIGMLYTPTDTKKHDGYHLFFMAIMSGAILGPFIFGLIAKLTFFRLCFLLCALGNLIGIAPFLFYRKQIRYLNLPDTTLQFDNRSRRFFAIALVSCLLLISLFFSYPIISNHLLGIASLITVIIFMLIALRSAHQQKNNIIGLTLLSLLLIIYYAASFQVNGSMIIAIADQFPLTLFDWSIPATTFASLEALFALLLTPVITRIWHYFNHPNWPIKLSCGLLFASASFFLFAFVFANKQFPLFYLLVANVLLGVSVVCIFPTHMAIVSEFAPAQTQGTLMGMSFLSDALAGYVGSMMISKQHYAIGYQHIANGLFITLLILIISIPLIKLLLPNQQTALVN